MQRLRTYIDRAIIGQLPAWVDKQADDVRRRARLVLYFAFVIFFCGPVYGALYLSLGMTVSALGAGAVMIMLVTTPAVMRAFHSVQAAAHWVALSCYVALALVTAPTGGIAAPAIAWLALLPVTALMLAGARGGMTWTAISLLTVLGYLVLDLTELTPPSEIPDAWEFLLRFLVNTGLVGLIALLAWMYESNKDRMLTAIQATNAELATARDDARDAHRDARLVLDHIGDGLMLVDTAGTLCAEPSRTVYELFGTVPPDAVLWELLHRDDRRAAQWLEAAWPQVFEGILPHEVAIDQLPKRCHFGPRTFQLRYVPVPEGGELTRMLVVLHDLTAELHAETFRQQQREQADVLRWVVQDRRYFVEFLEQAGEMVAGLASGAGSSADRLRWLHTLKGNAGLVDLHLFASACHEIENAVEESGQGNVTQEQGALIASQWDATLGLISPLLGAVRSDDAIVLRRLEYDQFLGEVQQGRPHDALYRNALRWTWEPTFNHLTRLAEQARALATRLGKGRVEVVVEDCGLRLPAERWAGFWAAAVHLIRNALDHGVESGQQRQAHGKPSVATLRLRTFQTEDGLSIEFSDDGQGIDWDAVKLKAAKRGLPVRDQTDLEDALFADGLSTSDTVTETSGRGVGMAAVRHACLELGGTLSVHSVRHAGTTFCLRFPWKTLRSQDALKKASSPPASNASIRDDVVSLR